MPDKLTPEQRHRNMAAIRAKDTKPEIIVRKYLWSHGFRYRLNHSRLPGKPDIVLRKYRTCIFVNGCFWHGHNLRYGNLRYEDENEDLRYENEDENEDLRYKNKNKKENENEDEDENEKGNGKENISESSECCKIPKTNREFWVKKIMRNQERDIEVQKKLAEMGWHCITIWECQLKSMTRKQTLDSLAYTLNHIFLMDRKPAPKRYEVEESPMMMVAEDEC